MRISVYYNSTLNVPYVLPPTFICHKGPTVTHTPLERYSSRKVVKPLANEFTSSSEGMKRNDEEDPPRFCSECLQHIGIESDREYSQLVTKAASLLPFHSNSHVHRRKSPRT